MTLNTNTWLQSSIQRRSEQFELLIAHIKRNMNQAIKEIDSDPSTGDLTGNQLLHWQYSLTRTKKFLTNPNGVGHGDLLDSDTKTFLVSYSVKADGSAAYSNIADLNSSIQSASAAFNAVTTELSALIVLGRSRGQFTDVDDATHEPVQMTFNVADMADLRTAVVTLIALLG